MPERRVRGCHSHRSPSSGAARHLLPQGEKEPVAPLHPHLALPTTALPRAKTRGLMHPSTRVAPSMGPGSTAGEDREAGEDLYSARDPTPSPSPLVGEGARRAGEGLPQPPSPLIWRYRATFSHKGRRKPVAPPSPPSPIALTLHPPHHRTSPGEGPGPIAPLHPSGAIRGPRLCGRGSAVVGRGEQVQQTP